jgi:sarcosine oxidase subunit alpha
MGKGAAKMSDCWQPVGLLVIGGGPAGLAAAIAAWDSGCRDILVLERDERLGGILPQCIHSGFGLHRFREELTGPEYIQKDITALAVRKIPFCCGAMALDIQNDLRVTAVSPRRGLMQYQARAVVLATGCRERPRGALGIPGTRCAGIMTAGTAQRLINLEGYLPGRRAVILGSGDIGLIMARRLTLEGVKVLACAEIMPFSSGLTRNVVQCLYDYNIPLLLSHTVTGIHGRERLEGVTLSAVDPASQQVIAGSERDLACDTLLLSVGLIPENELAKGAQVPLAAATGGPMVDQELATAVSGVFACGNCLHVHDLADDVSAEAAQAGRAAAAWIAGTRLLAADRIPVFDGQGLRGVVPQTIRRPTTGFAGSGHSVRFTFRPDALYRGAAVLVAADGRILGRYPKRILAPGEMAAIDFDLRLLPAGPIGELSLRLEVNA